MIYQSHVFNIKDFGGCDFSGVWMRAGCGLEDYGMGQVSDQYLDVYTSTYIMGRGSVNLSC